MIWQIFNTKGIEPFHFSREGDQRACKLIATKESVHISSEFNFHKIGLGHQYGRLDVVWKHSIIKGCRTLDDFFVVELQIFCRGQIELRFVGLSACRTLADFLSRLTALRLGAESFKIKIAPIPLTWLSWHLLIGWGAREPQQIVLVHRALAYKARQDVLRSSTVRNRPTSPDLVADSSEFAH